MEEALIFQEQFAVPFAYEQRTYQLLELPNGIHGLIITDPSEDLVSCCLSVAVGHHSNPDNIPGLAHLCEHMVLLSSKDFPEIDAYRKAVYLAGGTRNAVTNNESTSFYFSVPITSTSQNSQSSVENILEIFTSNFDSPNFEASYSNREIYAVDNEHTINKSKKNRLSFQGYKLLSNGQHQFSRFSTGNFDSLTESSRKYDIRSKLIEFFKTEYTPDKMAFVLRGPQSLNYLQKLAIKKFGKIGASKISKNSLNQLKPKFTTKLLDSNILEETWSRKYINEAFPKSNLQRAVLIDKDSDATLRIGFPVCFKNMKFESKTQFHFFINYWCELFGSESSQTIASVLFAKNLITSIMTKTSSITYDTILLEIELTLTKHGLFEISTIFHAIFNFVSLFNSHSDSKFIKHLSKSMSQFNGIGIYNFLFSETESQSVLEAKILCTMLLSDIESYKQFFVKGSTLYDQTTPNFQGAYQENELAKEWWLREALLYCHFVSKFIAYENMIVSFVGELSMVNLDWVENLPTNYNKEKYFDFEYKVATLNPTIVNIKDLKEYALNLPPPNIFADDIVENQTKLLQISNQTIENSKNASLGYSVKNGSLDEIPKLFHSDSGCQLWIKTEIDNMFKNKVMLTVELINTKLEANARYVAILEILIQLVKSRVNEYLYPALIMDYRYDLFPSFKGDTGILLHVSGPKQKFSKVLMILIYELKLISDKFETCITPEEFEKAKNKVLLKYENGNNMSTLECASLGLMATMEEDTWLLDQRIEACQTIDIKNIDLITSKLFSSCYLSAFLQGDINCESLNDDVLPVITKLVDKFEGENHKFPSSVLLPIGSNYYVQSLTKDANNGIEYFLQTCIRDDYIQRSITKFVVFIMARSLATKIRTEYQLGYIVLVGLRTFRKTQGIHISIISGRYSANELESKLDDLIIEWYEQNIKKIKQSQLNELIEKFISLETVSSKLGSNSGKSSIFFGAIGSSSGDKKIVKQHNSYWEQIHNKIYSFSNNMHGEDSIDLNIIKSIKVNEFIDFITYKVLPTSNQRSKVCVQIDSKLSREEVEENYKGIELFLFLTSSGLPIKQDHLEDILKRSGSSQIILCKNLYKYYREKGKSITLIAAVMAKLSKSILFSNTETAAKVESAISKVEIDISDLKGWQKKVGYVDDKISMREKLSKF
jgi:protease AXL1